MKSLFDAPLAIVDLETTGAHPAWDRVTEIAVRFDYGFLRHAFERAGLRFQAKTLCTVKLSRRLYPGHARHNLDSLIDRHRLRCDARRR